MICCLPAPWSSTAEMAGGPGGWVSARRGLGILNAWSGQGEGGRVKEDFCVRDALLRFCLPSETLDGRCLENAPGCKRMQKDEEEVVVGCLCEMPFSACTCSGEQELVRVMGLQPGRMQDVQSTTGRRGVGWGGLRLEGLNHVPSRWSCRQQEASSLPMLCVCLWQGEGAELLSLCCRTL